MSPTPLTGLYRPSLALLTDLYQLTMAYGYWKQGLHEPSAAGLRTAQATVAQVLDRKPALAIR